MHIVAIVCSGSWQSTVPIFLFTTQQRIIVGDVLAKQRGKAEQQKENTRLFMEEYDFDHCDDTYRSK